MHADNRGMLRPLFLALFLLTFLPLPAQALVADVRCVQEQLTAAGQDPGPVDGIVGRRTQAALRVFAEGPGLDTTSRLTRETATNWCRRIGLAVPELRRFWPSASNALIVETSTSVDPVLARLIRTRLPGIHREVAELLGIELAGTDRVLVGTGVAELHGMLSDWGAHRMGDPRRALTEHCDPEQVIGGFAAPGLMVICLAPGTRLRLDLSYAHLSFVLAHEATHLVQFQLTGVPPPGTPARDRVASEGPVWLLEGLADTVGYAIAYRVAADEIRQNGLRRFEGASLPDLALLQDRSALLSHRAEIYRAGMIAAAMLVEDRGFAEAGRLFALLGEGQRFERAFSAVYGESLTDFYRGFAERARPGEAGRLPPAPSLPRKK